MPECVAPSGGKSGIPSRLVSTKRWWSKDADAGEDSYQEADTGRPVTVYGKLYQSTDETSNSIG
jgi:hypothetical protein